MRDPGKIPSMGWFFLFAGGFSVAGAALDWDWFMNNRRAWLFVKLFGRGGARVVYVLIGLGLAVLGGMMVGGVVDVSDG